MDISSRALELTLSSVLLRTVLDSTRKPAGDRLYYTVFNFNEFTYSANMYKWDCFYLKLALIKLTQISCKVVK